MDCTGKLSNQTDEMSGSMILRAVGVVRNKMQEPFLKAGENGIEMQGEMDDVKERVNASYMAISEVIIKEEYVPLLDGIDEYSHITVLYWAHKVPETSRLLKHVHPMGRKENPLMGIFSTCSPARPNPVLMTVVKLDKREGNVLHVIGLDAVDQSPIIDIKPYVMEFFPGKEVRIAGWMRKIQDEVNSGKKD
ncbi:MAG: tRNA (N6-threonylcarbamoyladenosine(37)-N6)-methyltransferase TrmO [Desulfobacteraceae bacterium]|jgi:tRNA-Thr(GGU) m(6)t(6)A37 methyltransferase TsaA